MPLTEAERARVAEINSNYHAYDNGNLMRSVRRLLTIIAHLSEQPEVVQSEWINPDSCPQDASGYADCIAYVARHEMDMEFWECKACGSIDKGSPRRKPCYCRGCGATMRNGDFDKRKTDGQRAGEEEHG